MSNFALGDGVTIVGAEETAQGNNYVQSNLMVSPGYFETLSIPLLAGRDFTESDSRGEPAVAIVNESFLRRFGLGADAIGQRIRLSGYLPFMPRSTMEIVGIAGDARLANVKSDMQAQFFTPRPPADDTFSSMFFYVQSGIDPDVLAQRIPRIVERIDSTMPVANLTTLERQAETTIFVDRLVTQLSASFAALATALAAIGLYGMLAYLVTQRTRELGLRLALGAKPGDLRAMMLKQVARTALVGGAIGLVAAIGLGRIAQAMLYGLSSYDPFVLTGAVVVLSLVVLAAGWFPAHAASRVAPMEALRHE
jgi:predicted permease